MPTLSTDQETRLKTITAETLGVDADEITEDTSPQTVASWTSFQHLTLMAAVEEAFGCQFSMEEMTGITCFGDLRQVLAATLA